MTKTITRTMTSQDLEAQEARKTASSQYKCIYLKNVTHITADHCIITDDCRQTAGLSSLSV